MSKYVIENTTLTAIADAVRQKAGTTEPILVSDLPEAISNIPAGGGGGSTFSDCRYLFYGGARLEAFDNLIAAAKNVTNTHRMCSNMAMFNGSPVTQLDLSNLDVSKVTDMRYMFEYCIYLNKIDFSNWNTENVTDMTNMFIHCRAMANYDFSNWNTSKVTNFSNMFTANYALKFINISDFDGTSAINTSNMFQLCNVLEALVINNQNVFPMTNINMFTNSTIANGTGFVYVPDNMVDIYKSATNWSTYADQIKGMSELPQEYGGTAQ